MSFDQVAAIASAILYEGYVLYPYRPSSIKNRVRFTFGGLYPPSYSREQTGSDTCSFQAECLVEVNGAATVAVKFCFLHLTERESYSHTGRRVWQEALERDVSLTFDFSRVLASEPLQHDFAFAAERAVEMGAEGEIVRRRAALRGRLTLSASEVGPSLYRLRLVAENTSNGAANEREAALPETLAAAHALIGVEGARFISLLEHDDSLREAVAGCRNVGVFPVLVGSRQAQNRVLASPIILYDYPEIAAQSPGDLFDATEIDEILSLRILTMTDEEKREASGADPRVQALIERTEGLSGQDLMELHGVLRSAPTSGPRPFKAGDRVRLAPKRRADVFDIALAGKVATVRSVEQDFEDRIHLSVTVDDDPGADLGISGQPGHRFFFGVDEVERLDEGAAS